MDKTLKKMTKEKKNKKICHVCGKEKKPYVVFMNDSLINWITHDQAREDGEICERCDKFFAMTGEFKDATKEEFEVAQEACKFARNMLKWWEKDKKLNVDDGVCLREWDGTNNIIKWFRKEHTLIPNRASGEKKW